MPTLSDYQLIKKARSDYSDELVHMAKDGEAALRAILQDGYLKATFAERNGNPTVRGDRPVVCFSEMPVSQVKALAAAGLHTARYSCWAILFDKRELFRPPHNARPVVYGDHTLLDSLGEAHRHLGVYLDLSDLLFRNTFNDGVTDWTHEREWRCLPASDSAYPFANAGLPLHLNVFGLKRSTFRVLVPDAAAVLRTKAHLSTIATTAAEKGSYDEAYRQTLASVDVVTP